MLRFISWIIFYLNIMGGHCCSEDQKVGGSFGDSYA